MAEPAVKLEPGSTQTESLAKDVASKETENGTKQADKLPKGVAPIKKEFLVLVKDKVINWDFVPDDQRAAANGEDNGGADNDNKGEKRPKVDDRDLPDNHKKFKLRGQNKNKLRYKLGQRNIYGKGAGDDDVPKEKVDKSRRLCLKFSETSQCSYGDKCNYCHDPYKIYKINEEKPSEVADQPCFIYSSYGKCQFGVACIFSKHHTHAIEDTKLAFNLINQDLWSLKGGRENYIEKFSNRLDNVLQIQLRKKAYDFKVVAQIMSKLYQADIGKEQEEEQASDGEAPNEQAPSVPAPKEPVSNDQSEKRIGAAIVDEYIKNARVTKKMVDFKEKLYLAPLTTVGNLPFRRLCKTFGCDITCAEMSLCTSLLNGNPSEWSHLKRHESEDVFGAQITASHPDHAAKIVKVLSEHCELDFIDINCGCPTEWIYQTGAGAGLMTRGSKLRKMIASCCMLSKVPVTVKMRSGCAEDKNIAHNLIRSIVTPFSAKHIGAITVHGRSRNQRYTKSADWDYINQCGEVAGDIPLLGSGDCISWQEYYQRLEDHKNVSGVMLARGALISPWLFTEIKERRTWDISSKERLDIVRSFAYYALDHWGSDATGVENSRRYLLEWLSFACRYIPVGLLEVLPQKINDRPPKYKGRDELETLLSSPAASDWVKISEMFFGKVPEGFKFLPKHKSNAYESVVEG